MKAFVPVTEMPLPDTAPGDCTDPKRPPPLEPATLLARVTSVTEIVAFITPPEEPSLTRAYSPPPEVPVPQFPVADTLRSCKLEFHTPPEVDRTNKYAPAPPPATAGSHRHGAKHTGTAQNTPARITLHRHGKK